MAINNRQSIKGKLASSISFGNCGVVGIPSKIGSSYLIATGCNSLGIFLFN
ncbi:MAG: hypothetical protein RR086_02285 [Clostridia bacterium]